MPNVLISGPAGGGKSQAARAELERLRANGPVALADFQAIYVALTGVERDSNGRYPMRDETLFYRSLNHFASESSSPRESEISEWLPPTAMALKRGVITFSGLWVSVRSNASSTPA